MKDTTIIKDLWVGDFPKEEQWIKKHVKPTYLANEEDMTDHIYGVEVSEMLIEHVDIPEFINPFIIVEIGQASYFRFIE